jgi:hypothetical protein
MLPYSFTRKTDIEDQVSFSCRKPNSKDRADGFSSISNCLRKRPPMFILPHMKHKFQHENALQSEALADLGIPSYEPAQTKVTIPGYNADSQRAARFVSCVCGSEDWGHFLRDWRWHLLNFLLGSTAWYLPPFINASNTLMRRDKLGICRQ